MLGLSSISIGLLGALAAWIAGVFSLLGLVVSKEQKTSEFRQQWIDQLRVDIALVVAHFNSLHTTCKARESESNLQVWKDAKEDFLELSRATTRVKLRLNPNEPESKVILNLIARLESMVAGQPLGTISFNDVTTILDSIEKEAPALLKAEWIRVKAGEPIYQRAKWAAGVLSVIVILFYLFLVGVSIYGARSQNPSDTNRVAEERTLPSSSSNSQTVTLYNNCGVLSNGVRMKAKTNATERANGCATVPPAQPNK